MTLSTSAPICAQNALIDSLRNLLQTELNDSSKVAVLNAMAFANRRINIDSAIIYSRQAIEFSKETNNPRGTAIALKNLGLAYRYSDRMEESLKFMLEAVEVCKENNLKHTLGVVYNNLGNLHFRMESYEKCEEYYLFALQIREEVNDKGGMAKTLGNLGNLANAYHKDKDMALDFYNRSLALDEQIGNDEGIAITSLNLSNIYKSRNDQENAFRLLMKAIKYDEKRNDKHALTYDYGNLGNFHRELGNLDSALYYHQLVLKLALETKSPRRIRLAYGKLAHTYMQMNQYKEAFEYQVKYQNITDSITKNNTKQQLAEIQAKYDDEVKEKELVLLRSENDINQAKLKNQRNERVIGILILVMLVGGVLSLRFRIKTIRKQANILKLQKQALSKKSVEINEVNKTLKSRNVELHETLEKLQTAQDQLVESEKMASIGVLTAGLAHELNNPLSFIGGAVEPLKADLEDIIPHLPEKVRKEQKEVFDEINDLLEGMSDGVVKAAEIIRNLVDISPKNSKSQISTFDLCEMIKSTAKLISSTYRNVSVNLEIPDQLNLTANKIEINQVLLNVAKNAIDAIAEDTKGHILITAACQDEVINVSVTDNGIGIPENEIKQVFEPFFTTKEPNKGTGLGMYISYSIIKKHNGEISITSDQSKGTTVMITIPTDADRIPVISE